MARARREGLLSRTRPPSTRRAWTARTPRRLLEPGGLAGHSPGRLLAHAGDCRRAHTVPLPDAAPGHRVTLTEGTTSRENRKRQRTGRISGNRLKPGNRTAIRAPDGYPENRTNAETATDGQAPRNGQPRNNPGMPPRIPPGIPREGREDLGSRGAKGGGRGSYLPRPLRPGPPRAAFRAESVDPTPGHDRKCRDCTATRDERPAMTEPVRTESSLRLWRRHRTRVAWFLYAA